jgi:hypothetical protein
LKDWFHLLWFCHFFNTFNFIGILLGKGESTLRMNHFSSKKVILCITNILVHSKLKFWWHPFDYPKHKQKKFKFTRHHFGTQNSFWVKINLDPMVKRRRLNKINVCRIYNLQIFYDNKASCLWFMKHYQTKEN